MMATRCSVVMIASKLAYSHYPVYCCCQDENKEIALGTSKLNYLDPRITVAWYVPLSACLLACDAGLMHSVAVNIVAV